MGIQKKLREEVTHIHQPSQFTADITVGPSHQLLPQKKRLEDSLQIHPTTLLPKLHPNRCPPHRCGNLLRHCRRCPRTPTRRRSRPTDQRTQRSSLFNNSLRSIIRPQKGLVSDLHHHIQFRKYLHLRIMLGSHQRKNSPPIQKIILPQPYSSRSSLPRQFTPRPSHFKISQ